MAIHAKTPTALGLTDHFIQGVTAFVAPHVAPRFVGCAGGSTGSSATG